MKKRVQQFAVLHYGLSAGPVIRKIFKPAFFVAILVGDSVIKGKFIAALVKMAGAAVHIAEIALTGRADTAAVLLLPTAIGVDIAVVIIKIGLADRHPLVQVLEVDTVFLGLALVFMEKKISSLWILKDTAALQQKQTNTVTM